MRHISVAVNFSATTFSLQVQHKEAELDLELKHEGQENDCNHGSENLS